MRHGKHKSLITTGMVAYINAAYHIGYIIKGTRHGKMNHY